MDAGKPAAEGHRARLRQRFLKVGLDGFSDYEALELLLTYAIPRKDVKPLAKALLLGFHSFGGVLDAPAEELLNFPGLGPAAVTMLKIVRAASCRYLEQRALPENTLKDRKQIVDFLRMKLGDGKRETMAVLFFSSRNHLLHMEFYSGTLDRAAIYPREVAAEALRCSAAGVIIAHNHPSGLCIPSQPDVMITRAIRDALRTVGVLLYDHYVVTPGGCTSVDDWKQ